MTACPAPAGSIETGYHHTPIPMATATLQDARRRGAPCRAGRRRLSCGQPSPFAEEPPMAEPRYSDFDDLRDNRAAELQADIAVDLLHDDPERLAAAGRRRRRGLPPVPDPGRGRLLGGRLEGRGPGRRPRRARGPFRHRDPARRLRRPGHGPQPAAGAARLLRHRGPGRTVLGRVRRRARRDPLLPGVPARIMGLLADVAPTPRGWPARWRSPRWPSSRHSLPRALLQDPMRVKLRTMSGKYLINQPVWSMRLPYAPLRFLPHGGHSCP